MRGMISAVAALGLVACSADGQAVSGSEAFDRYWQESDSVAGQLYDCRLYAADLTTEEAGQCAEIESEYSDREPATTDDLDSFLLAAIIEGGGDSAIVERFASSLGVTPDEARLAADLMLDAQIFSSTCDNYYLGCPWPEDGHLLSLWTHAGQSPLAPALLSALADGSFDQNALRLPQGWGQSPAAAQFLIERYRNTANFRIFVTATRGSEPSVELLQAVFTAVPDDVRPEDQLAYFDWLATRLPAHGETTDAALLITAFRMREALRVGLGSDAVRLYQALPDSDRQRMWDLTSGSPENLAEAQRARQQSFELLVWLAGAHAVQGDNASATALLDRADAIAVFTDEDRQVAEADAAASTYRQPRHRIAAWGDTVLEDFLREQSHPQLSPIERYNVFITGSPDGVLSTPGVNETVDGTTGWLWRLVVAPADLRGLAADYLDTPETLALRDYVETQGAVPHRWWPDGGVLDFDDAQFAALRDERLARSEAQDAPGEPAESTANRLTIFHERSLPPGSTSLPMRVFSEPADIAGSPELPVDPWQVARLEHRGDVWDLIYTSTELDPTGEVSAGGYWYVQGSADGSWQTPIYLGLQQFFPYVVLPGSSLPLVDGDRLQIAVAVRELDPESITFPPVGLRALRQADDLVIEASFLDLLRDQDADGLTDIFEHRIGLDPLDADTDGDGYMDGVDGLPLTAFDPSRAGQGELGRIMLEQVFGFDAGAIRVPLSDPEAEISEIIAAGMAGAAIPAPARSTLIMRGDPEMFAGLMTRDRIIVLDEAAIARISPEYGILYPLGMSAVLPNADASQVYVIWSAGWVGGEFYIHRDGAGGYVVEVTSSWIT